MPLPRITQNPGGARYNGRVTSKVGVGYETGDGGTIVSVISVADGSFTIRVHNGNVAAGTAETGAIIINFAIIKGASA